MNSLNLRICLSNFVIIWRGDLTFRDKLILSKTINPQRKRLWNIKCIYPKFPSDLFIRGLNQSEKRTIVRNFIPQCINAYSLREGNIFKLNENIWITKQNLHNFTLPLNFLYQQILKKKISTTLGRSVIQIFFKKRKKLNLTEKSQELLLKTAGEITTFVKILGTWSQNKFWNEEVRNYMLLITFAWG